MRKLFADMGVCNMSFHIYILCEKLTSLDIFSKRCVFLHHWFWTEMFFVVFFWVIDRSLNRRICLAFIDTLALPASRVVQTERDKRRECGKRTLYASSLHG